MGSDKKICLSKQGLSLWPHPIPSKKKNDLERCNVNCKLKKGISPAWTTGRHVIIQIYGARFRYLCAWRQVWTQIYKYTTPKDNGLPSSVISYTQLSVISSATSSVPVTLGSSLALDNLSCATLSPLFVFSLLFNVFSTSHWAPWCLLSLFQFLGVIRLDVGSLPQFGSASEIV